MARFQRLAAATCAAALLGGGEAGAGGMEVRDAVAVVIVSGTNTAQGNAPDAEVGTGFWVSHDGYLVTAHHLITRLIERGVDKDTITIQVQLADKTFVAANPTPPWTGQIDDVMVLFASLEGKQVKTLTRWDRKKVKLELGKTQIFSAGYPKGLGYSYTPGTISSLEGPKDPIPLWTTNLTFKKGQSGSPIVLVDDTVLAIAKGDDAEATQIGFIVPLRSIPGEYWDGGPAGDIANTDKILIEARVELKQPVFRQAQLTFTNAACAGPQRQVQRFMPRAGYHFDPDVARVDLISSRGLNGLPLIDRASADEVVVATQLKNLGVCLFDGRVPDIPAEVQARLTLKEVPDPAPQWAPIATVSLAKDVRAPVPSLKAGEVRFSVLKPDGALTAFIPTTGELTKSVFSGATTLDTAAVRKRLSE